MLLSKMNDKRSIYGLYKENFILSQKRIFRNKNLPVQSKNVRVHILFALHLSLDTYILFQANVKKVCLYKTNYHRKRESQTIEMSAGHEF